MRPDKSRASRRALRRREFDLEFKIICSLISLSGFVKSQVFARLLGRVWKQLKVSPSFGLACRKLHTSYFTLTCRKKWAVSFLHWRPFCSLCLHQRLEACRRSHRPLYRRSSTKGLLFAFHRKFSFNWLISQSFQAISPISGLHFHCSELQTLGSVVEKSLLFLW